MEQKILSIDIGSYSVKVCEVVRSFREFELKRYFEQPLTSSSGRLTHEETVATTLRGLLEKNKVEADYISVTLPGHLVSVRVLRLPFTNAKKIDQIIEFELESYVPISLDDLLVDYHILDIGDTFSTVIVAYVPRGRFVKYLDMLQLAGIDPKYVGVDVIDLSHIAQIAMLPASSVYAIVDIGHSKTSICVMEGKKLIYARTITLGGNHFTRAIQKVFKLNPDKAEALKLDRGRVNATGEDLDQISRLCMDVAEELTVALKQTYLGFRQVYKDKDWSAMYMTGGGARLAGLPELISSRMRLHIGTLDFMEFMPNNLNQPEMVKDKIAPCLAQVLKIIYSNRSVKINFRRGEFASKKDMLAIGSEIKQVGLYFGLVVIMALSYFMYSYYTLNERIDRVNTDFVKSVIKALPDLKKEKKKDRTATKLKRSIDSKIAEIKPQLDALRKGGGGMTPLMVLNEISRVIPAKDKLEINIDDFSLTDGSIKLDGRTNSFEAVDILKASLEKSELFKEVTTRNVNKGIRDEIKFSISIELLTEEEA